MSVPAATIGAVRLIAPAHATSTLTATLPTYLAGTEHQDTLYVVLKTKYLQNERFIVKIRKRKIYD
jgi:hypothetical protein